MLPLLGEKRPCNPHTVMQIQTTLLKLHHATSHLLTAHSALPVRGTQLRRSVMQGDSDPISQGENSQKKEPNSEFRSYLHTFLWLCISCCSHSPYFKPKVTRIAPSRYTKVPNKCPSLAYPRTRPHLQLPLASWRKH